MASGEHYKAIPRTHEKSITLADTPYTLTLGYNCVKVDTTGGNVRVNLPDTNYPIDVIKTSSDAYIVTVWVGGTQIGEIAGELSSVTVESGQITKDEPWYPYDCIVGIAGDEVLAKNRYGKVIAGCRGVAGTDDMTVINVTGNYLNDLGGGHLHFSIGEFRIKFPGLVYRNNFEISGNGYNTVLKLDDNALDECIRGIPIISRDRYTTCAGVYNPPSSPWPTVCDIYIHDLQLDGNKTNNVATTNDHKYYSSGIMLTNTERIEIERIIAHDCMSGGIYIESGASWPDSDCHVKDCWVYGNGKEGTIDRSGVICDVVRGVTLENILSSTNRGAGFSLGASSKVVGRNLKSVSNVSYGANFISNCHSLDIEIEANSNGTHGVYIACPDSIFKIKSIDNSGAGAYLPSTAMRNMVSVCTRNSVMDTVNACIQLVGAVGNTISIDAYNCAKGAILTSNAIDNNVSGVFSTIYYNAVHISNCESNTLENIVSDICSQGGNNAYSNIKLDNALDTKIVNGSLKTTSAIKSRYRIEETGTTTGTIIDATVLGVGGLGKCSFIGSTHRIRSCSDYPTSASGSSTGTGSEQTIAHGLAAIPTGCKAWITYLVGTRYVTEMIPFDATNVYPTVATGTAYNWRIE